jgi:hypothetical protein
MAPELQEEANQALLNGGHERTPRDALCIPTDFFASVCLLGTPQRPTQQKIQW